MSRLWSSQEGVTLVGVLAVVSILSLLWTFGLSKISTTGTALIQKPPTRIAMVDGDLAVKYLDQATDLFASDARAATRTTLVDGAPPVSSVSLSWTDEYQDIVIPQRVSYSLEGNVLVRTYNGKSRIVARKLVSVAFSLSGNQITAALEVEAEPDATKTFTVNTLMGLPPG